MPKLPQSEWERQGFPVKPLRPGEIRIPGGLHYGPRFPLPAPDKKLTVDHVMPAEPKDARLAIVKAFGGIQRGTFLGRGRTFDAVPKGPFMRDVGSDLGRPLPMNLDAEKAVLGAVLLDNAVLNVAIKSVYPEDFFLDQHRQVYTRMLAMKAKQKNIDLVTLVDELQGHGALEASGGAPYLASLADGMPKISNVEYYAKIVREKAILRNVIHATANLLEHAYESDASETVVNKAMEIFTRFASETRGTEPLIVTPIEDLLSRLIKPREMLLDPILPQQGLAMLYAYRGVGKTYVALGISAAIASGGKFLRWTAPKPRRVLYIDGELPQATLQERAKLIISGMEGARTIPRGALRFITPDEQLRAMPDLSTAEGQALVEPHLDGVEFVVVDNLSALCRMGVENESESWLPIQEWALRLRRHGVTVLFVHHAGKNKTQRGTSRREDLLDVVIALRQSDTYEPSDGLRCEVHFEKTRGLLGDAARPFEIKLSSGLDGWPVWTTTDLRGGSEEACFALFDGGATVRDVAEQLGVSRSNVGRMRVKWEANNKK